MKFKNKDLKELYDNKNFQKILDFYLFNCPVISNGKKVSKRAKTFKELSYEKGDYTSFINAMKELCTHNFQYISCDNNISFDSSYKDSKHKFVEDTEFIIIKNNCNMNKTETLFYSIRNALAHGSFDYKKLTNDMIYFFESNSSKSGEIISYMSLTSTTLLKWIDLFELRKKKTNRRKKLN